MCAAASAWSNAPSSKRSMPWALSPAARARRRPPGMGGTPPGSRNATRSVGEPGRGAAFRASGNDRAVAVGSGQYLNPRTEVTAEHVFAQHACRRPGGGHASAAEQKQPVRELAGQGQVVYGRQDRQRPLTAKLVDELERVHAAAEVQRPGRLVEQGP